MHFTIVMPVFHGPILLSVSWKPKGLMYLPGFLYVELQVEITVKANCVASLYNSF